MTPADRAVRAVNEFGPACVAYGFKPGTPEYAGCIQNAANEEQARYNAAAAVLYRGTRPSPTITCQSTTTSAGTSNTICR